ncbi:MAG: hypothetical protein ACI9WU_005223 [Myxococcota bacterium]|jgi:hypothetical protein
MQDVPGVQVDYHRHVAMPLVHGKLVDADASDPAQSSLCRPALQMFLEDAFDRVPTHAQQPGHLFDGHQAAQLCEVAPESPLVYRRFPSANGIGSRGVR